MGVDKVVKRPEDCFLRFCDKKCMNIQKNET